MANELRHADVGTALSKSEWEATGGHIFNSQAAGDIMYASTTSQLTRLGIGTANQVLATNSGATAPEWVSSVALATLATTVTISANNSTNETVYPVFVDGATGTQGAETDTGLTYNPSSGLLTATGFSGNLTGTLQTASQTAITAVGTIATGVWQGTAIASGYIAGDAITGAKIADDAIDSEHYTDGSIDTAHLAADVITGAKIADDAIDSEHYTDGSIDTAHLAADAVTGAKIADDAIDSEHYTDGSIDNAHIADNAIDSEHYADGSIDNAHIADDAIDSEHYAAGSIDTAHIGDDQVTYAKIQNVSATNKILGRDSSSAGVIEEISPSSLLTMLGVETAATADQTAGEILTLLEDGIDSVHYKDGSIDNVHIADDAIDSEHYADGSIDNAHLADNSVDSDNYVDGSIDNAHLADNSVDSDNYVDGSIDNAHIADDAIDSEHYAAASIDFAHMQNVAANSILGRNANSSGVLSEVALATTQVLIGDGTGFTAAALSGDATMTNAGVVTIAAGAIDIAMLAGGTDGKIITWDANGDPAVVGPGTDGQVLTSAGAGQPPAFEDAGGGGTIALTADGVLAVGEAVAIDSGGQAVAISGYAEVFHDLTQMADFSDGYSHFRGHVLVPIADGTNRVMRFNSFSGWGNYLTMQVGTYVSATREMTWGTAVRTTHQPDTMDAYYDSAEDVVVLAYQDGGDGQAGALLVIQPHASANTIITSTSGTDIAPVRSEFDSGNLHSLEHYGIHIVEEAVTNKCIISFVDADDAGECYLWAGTIVPDDDTSQPITGGTGTADRHKVYTYIANTLVSANGQAATGHQLGFNHGKGLVVYNNASDSEYTHARGFVIDTSSGPAFALTDEETDGTSEPFGANKKVMMSPDVGTSHDTPVVNQISYDSDNDVWLIAGGWLDGDSDAVPVLATLTVGTRTTAGPGAGFDENTLAFLDTFNIASAESPLSTPPSGSGHRLTIDTATSTAEVELQDDFVFGANANDFMPTVAFDEDRNCHVMALLAMNNLYDGGMHKFRSNPYPRFFTITTVAAGTGIAVLDAGGYIPRLPREEIPSNQIDWGLHTNAHATDGYVYPRLVYDTSNNVMFHTCGYTSMLGGGDNTAHSDTVGLHVGAFFGRTTTAAGGAIGSDATEDAKTRALVYNISNMSNFIGFNTIARTDTQAATITVAGGLNENQSSLTVGQRYFVADDGVLRAKLPGMTMNLHRAGVTQAATKLLVTGEQHSNN